MSILPPPPAPPTDNQKAAYSISQKILATVKAFRRKNKEAVELVVFDDRARSPEVGQRVTGYLADAGYDSIVRIEAALPGQIVLFWGPKN